MHASKVRFGESYLFSAGGRTSDKRVGLIAEFLEVREFLDGRTRESHPQTLRTLLLFLYGTGALVGEALRLKREDVDLKVTW